MPFLSTKVSTEALHSIKPAVENASKSDNIMDTSFSFALFESSSLILYPFETTTHLTPKSMAFFCKSSLLPSIITIFSGSILSIIFINPSGPTTPIMTFAINVFSPEASFNIVPPTAFAIMEIFVLIFLNISGITEAMLFLAISIIPK